MDSKDKNQVLDAIIQLLMEKEHGRNTPYMGTDMKTDYTLTQLHIVSLIHQNPMGCNNTYLAEHLKISKPAVTKAVKKLIENNAIDGCHKEGDRKSIYYSLTSSGRELAERHDAYHDQVMERYHELLDLFNTTEMEVITRFLTEWKQRLFTKNN